MTVTIKDIASLAGVSHMTVSRALNNSSSIKEDTKKKIEKIAKELGYIPNYNAKSLVLDRSFNIGLFLSTLNLGTSQNFFYETVRGVSNTLDDAYNLVIRGINELQNFNSLNKKRFDGILLMSQSKQDDAFILNVQNKNIPIVVLNREIPNSSIINILTKDKKGAYTLIEYLLKLGHTKIALIQGKKDFAATQSRKEGYLEALQSYNVPVVAEYIIKGNYDYQSGYEAMKSLLTCKDKPTAVFCSNDEMAIGAIKFCQEKGILVPDDISIAGFDENSISTFMNPSLTTVRRPIYDLSREGTKLLLKIIEDPAKKTIEYVHWLDTELIIRESTGPFNKK